MYNIYKFDYNNLTENELEKLFLVNKTIVKKYNLLNRFKDINDYKDLFLSTFKLNDNELFLLKNDLLICGIINCVKSIDWSGKEQYKLSIFLGDTIIDKLILDILNQLIQEKLNQYGEIALVTYNNEFEAIIKNYTNKVNLRGNYYTLIKEDIDIEKLNKDIKEYEIKNNDLLIKFTDIISNMYIDQYCDLFMETMEDMTDTKEEGYVKYIITPEKQRQINEANKKRNISHYCFMIFNSGNEMVAKTNVSINNNDPRFPYQFMIGVKKSYRGRNIGKWLYASIYKKLYETVNFDRVLVCHHPDNKPAINISKWIGYKFNYLETIHILYK